MKKIFAVLIALVAVLMFAPASPASAEPVPANPDFTYAGGDGQYFNFRVDVDCRKFSSDPDAPTVSKMWLTLTNRTLQSRQAYVVGTNSAFSDPAFNVVVDQSYGFAPLQTRVLEFENLLDRFNFRAWRGTEPYVASRFIDGVNANPCPSDS